jgi:hypothetical protein
MFDQPGRQEGAQLNSFTFFSIRKLHPALSLSNAECGSVKFSPHCTGQGLRNAECENLKLISSDLATLTYCKAQPTVRRKVWEKGLRLLPFNIFNRLKIFII